MDRQEFPAIPDELPEGGEGERWRELNKVVLKACANDPADRYASAGALAEDLNRVAAGERLRHDGHALAWVAVLGVMAVVAFAFWPSGGEPVKGPSALDPLAKGLVLHYQFDSGPADASGSGNAAVIEWATPARDRHDSERGALRFGGNALLSASRPVVFGRDEPRAFACWFRVEEWLPRPAGSWLGEWESGRGAQLCSGIGFKIELRDNGFIGIDGHYTTAGLKAEALRLERWQHLTVSYNGTMGSVRGWLNGRPLPMVTNGFSFYQPNSTLGSGDSPGWKGGLRVAKFAGRLDEVRLYRRALSAAEAVAIYENEKPARPSRDDLDWDFEFGVGDVLDAAANRNIVERVNVKKWVEDFGNNASYWGPATNGAPASLTYRFDFAQPARRIFLNARAYGADVTATDPKGGRGAGALWASRDGTNWVSLGNGLSPKRAWSEAREFAGELPDTLTGAGRLLLKVELFAEGPDDLDYSAAQHLRTNAADRARSRQRLEVKAWWGGK